MVGGRWGAGRREEGEGGEGRGRKGEGEESDRCVCWVRKGRGGEEVDKCVSGDGLEEGELMPVLQLYVGRVGYVVVLYGGCVHAW